MRRTAEGREGQTQRIFTQQGGEKAAALEPVTERKVSGDFVRLKDTQDRCVESGPVPWQACMLLVMPTYGDRLLVSPATAATVGINSPCSQLSEG